MSELLSIDEKKWVMMIAEETYVILLVSKTLNSIASHLDPFNWNSLLCYGYWQIWPKKENYHTRVIPGHLMRKWWAWDRNSDYMSYVVMAIASFQNCELPEDLKLILWYFQLWKAWTATCWSAELCTRLNFQLLLSWVHI